MHFCTSPPPARPPPIDRSTLCDLRGSVPVAAAAAAARMLRETPPLCDRSDSSKRGEWPALAFRSIRTSGSPDQAPVPCQEAAMLFTAPGSSIDGIYFVVDSRSLRGLRR